MHSAAKKQIVPSADSQAPSLSIESKRIDATTKNLHSICKSDGQVVANLGKRVKCYGLWKMS